jgi:hypothetical protein
LSVLKNHFKTRSALFAGSFSAAGATNSEGCSAQYEEYSVKETPLRMKGGAVREEISPLNEAMDLRKEVLIERDQYDEGLCRQVCGVEVP